MRFILLLFIIVILAVGCGSETAVRQPGGLQEVFTRLQQDYANNQNPPRYFALFIPEHVTTRYTREKFRSDLVAASHATAVRDSLIYQDDWTRLFIIPDAYRAKAEMSGTQELYRLLMDGFDQGKPAGLLAMRTQLAQFDRFRRLSGRELRELDPWLQDMIRIPLDYLLLVDVNYQGYPDYLYAYELTLTLQDIRTNKVDAFARGTVLLPYRVK